MELIDVKAENPVQKTDNNVDISESNDTNILNNIDGKIRKMTDKTANQEENEKCQPSGKVVLDHVVNCIQRHRRSIDIGIKVFLLLIYLIYFGFAVANHKNVESSWRLIACTVFGFTLITWSLFKKTVWYVRFQDCLESMSLQYISDKRLLIIRW